MKDKKSIGFYLFKSNIVIIIMMILIIKSTSQITNFIVKTVIFKSIKWNNIQPNEMYKYPYDEINIGAFGELYGWAEVVNEDKKVIFVKGKKLDDIYQYTEEFLYDNAAIIHRDEEEYKFIYNIYPVKGPNGEPYLFIIKFPKNYYTVDINLKVFSKFESFSRVHISILIISIVTFLVQIFLGLFLYSKFTAKHIKNSLNYLRNGIKEMEKENYKERLNFYAEKEFGEIRDAFNNMAERLEIVELEKQKLIESKQRMFVDISHDLKTPITSIQGFSKLLYDNEVNNEEEKKKYLKYIYDKSVYVTNLIQDLFELSKLEDVSYKFIYQKENFAEWFRQVISEIYPEFERKEFNLNIDISEVPIMIYFDKKQMQRAIMNIFSNCIKYNPAQTTMWIYCYSDGEKVTLCIADDGVGIDEELKKNIFEPFVRGEKWRGNNEGTGLGLAITKKIIEKHSGTINIGSNSDILISEDLFNNEVSTVFIIELPIKECNR